MEVVKGHTDPGQQPRRTKATSVAPVLVKSPLCPMAAPVSPPLENWLPQNWPPVQHGPEVWPHSVSIPISLELTTLLGSRLPPEAKLKRGGAMECGTWESGAGAGA